MVYCPRCGGHMCWDKNAKGVGWWGCQDGCWLLVKGPQNVTNEELKDLYNQQKGQVKE